MKYCKPRAGTQRVSAVRGPCEAMTWAVHSARAREAHKEKK